MEAGAAIVVVSDLNVSPASHVMVTLTSESSDAAVAWVDRAESSFTVHLTAKVPDDTSFSYFVVDAV